MFAACVVLILKESHPSVLCGSLTCAIKVSMAIFAALAVAVITLSPGRIVERAAREQLLDGEMRHRLVFDRNTLLPMLGGPARQRHRRRPGKRGPHADTSRGFMGLFSAIFGGGGITGGAAGKPGSQLAMTQDVAVLTVYPEAYRSVCGQKDNGRDPVQQAWETPLGAEGQPTGTCGEAMRSIRRAARTAAATGLLVWEYAPHADVAAAGLEVAPKLPETRQNPFSRASSRERFASSHGIPAPTTPGGSDRVELHADGTTSRDSSE